MISDKELSNFRRFIRSGVPLKEFGPQGAFDSKPSRRGRDEEGGQPSAIAGMIALRDRMSPEGFKALCMSLCDEDGAEDGGEGEKYATPMERELAQGKDRKRGAMDSMAFDKLSTPPSTKADKSFAAMYPGAGDIKLNDHYPVASRVRA